MSRPALVVWSGRAHLRSTALLLKQTRFWAKPQRLCGRRPLQIPVVTPGSSDEHVRRAADSARRTPVGCAVLTVSDTRTARTDRSGPLVERLLVEGGHRIVDRAIVQDVPDRIARQLETWLEDPDVHAIVTTGGTGIALRDTTIEVVRRYLAIEIEGFGELFRMLSYERVKAAAMLSRAAAGLATDSGDDGRVTFIFAVPGSPDAVETAVGLLIAPQLAHLVWQRRKA